MTRSFRRYQVFLPRPLADDRQQSDARFGETLFEIRRRFSDQPGRVYCSDEMRCVFADVLDVEENQQFFRVLKDQLKSRFDALIWITSHPVNVI